MSSYTNRANLLIAQRRYDLAAKELRQALVANPGDHIAHALLALCLSEAKHHTEATNEAQQAVHLAPDLPFSHYVLASVLNDQERFAEAERAVNEAIRLDSEEADHFALAAQIKMQQRQWAGALEAAEEGLRLDPEHAACTNLRAMALVKLQRKDEAGLAIDAALSRDPENALTHANQGWTLLEQQRHTQALTHFREALRLDPQLEWAREGIVEALKARYFVYRIMLRYFLWISKLSTRAQWGLIIGAFIISRILRSVANTQPSLAPFMWPLLGVYFVFVISTWIARPLFNLLLRLDSFGRLTLSRNQITGSSWVGGCILAALVFGIAGALTGNGISLLAAVGCGMMVVPVAATSEAESARGRRSLLIYTIALATFLLTGLSALVLGLETLGVMAAGVFILGFFIFMWVANWIAIRN